MDGGTWAIIIAALITTAGPGLFALFKTRRTVSTATIDDLRKLVDDLQEQVAAERSARSEDNRAHRAEMLEVRADLAVATRGIRVRDTYIASLRRDISEGRPPPPRPWPPELLEP